MIDLCTVVFRDELIQLSLQAQSVDLYCQDLEIRNIYVVVNDDDQVSQSVIPDWWGKFADRVRVLPRSFFGCNWCDNGWVSQQVLKMITPATSYSKWSIILDAKTIFIRPLLLNQLFDSEGKAQVGVFGIQPVFEPSRKIISDLFNIKFEKQLGPAGVPFFVLNRIVREMIVEVETLTNNDFPTWFQNKGMVTEFMLYAGYIQYRYGNFDKWYSENVTVRPCNVCHSEVPSFDRKFKEMSAPKILTVSIHRRAWEQITTTQQEQYKEFLVERNITKAIDL